MLRANDLCYVLTYNRKTLNYQPSCKIDCINLQAAEGECGLLNREEEEGGQLRDLATCGTEGKSFIANCEL